MNRLESPRGGSATTAAPTARPPAAGATAPRRRTVRAGRPPPRGRQGRAAAAAATGSAGQGGCRRRRSSDRGQGGLLRARVPTCPKGVAGPTLPGMACRISELVIDCADPERLAAFWGEVLGYVELGREDDGSIEIGPPDTGFGGALPVLVLSPSDARGPGNCPCISTSAPPTAASRPSWSDCSRPAPGPSTSGRPEKSPGTSWPTRRATNSASSAPGSGPSDRSPRFAAGPFTAGSRSPAGCPVAAGRGTRPPVAGCRGASRR